MPRVHILPAETDLLADPDENLLKLLRRHQVPIRYSCKSGECGSCKCVLESGQVKLKKYDPKALPDAQRDSGIILACRAILSEDITIRLTDSDDLIAHPERKLLCRVVALEPLTQDIFALRLHIEFADMEGIPFTFSAGQYVQIVVEVDGQEIARDFSMASTPVDAEYDDLLEFHIRRTPTGALSSLLGGVIRPGAQLLVRGPMGTSYFRPRHQGPLYAVGGGTGLAPMLSVAQTALDNGKLEPVVLFAGFRNQADVYGLEQMEQMRRSYRNFSYHLALDEAQPGDPPQAVHRPLAAHLLEQVADFAGSKVYLAGPPGMVEAISASLLERGLPEKDLHADAFYPPVTAELAPAA
ncbi:2Fe-2S iron-sulfur cluster-binding protein [Thiomonas arsenitoxydans]|jgi:ferredoxin-NAD(P)+ reductase (naphthalene dioxygenase ferredoxin-specific)|nr:2Fe-2S iron-sulfur cluster-binding protein [Thiomonas arsenitoxydans]CAZ88855.1 putative Ferredoxin--NAD(+) reductase [Thiomonas arsenitoxydans]